GHGPAADSEPPLKRPKLLTRTYTHTTLRTRLAHAPASLRRAASLRAPASLSWDKENLAPRLPSSPALFKVVGVPIIAPPYPLPLGGPTDREAQARARLRRFVKREKELRIVEGYMDGEGEVGWGWEVIGDELREEVVRWFLEVSRRVSLISGGLVLIGMNRSMLLLNRRTVDWLVGLEGLHLYRRLPRVTASPSPSPSRRRPLPLRRP
ncbi:hypothetical protein H0H92_013661, partial [Tricholoma furcatifolium]